MLILHDSLNQDSKENKEHIQKKYCIPVKNISFPLLIGKEAKISYTENQHWTIVFGKEQFLEYINVSDNNNNENQGVNFSIIKNEIQIFNESLHKASVGDLNELVVVNKKFRIKNFFVEKSLFKSSSFLSLFGIHSPYLIFPTRINIILQSLTEAGESIGNLKILCFVFRNTEELLNNKISYKEKEIQTQPTLTGDFLKIDNFKELFNEAFTIKRLTWEEYQSNLPNIFKQQEMETQSLIKQ